MAAPGTRANAAVLCHAPLMSQNLGRMNEDATWWVEHGGVRILFDPWLVGDEVDYAPWFNRASHTGPVLPLAACPADLVIVSQHYADHCHPETLRRLRGNPRVATVPTALGPIQSATPEAEVQCIPPWGSPPLEVMGLRIWRLTRPWFHPPRYHAIVVADAASQAVVHAPHGVPASAAAALLPELEVAVLAISRMTYQLPFFLGGRVNPGNGAAVAAARACQARSVLAIHDEAKAATGLVSRLARVDRGPWPEDGLPWLSPAVIAPSDQATPAPPGDGAGSPSDAP